MEATVIRVPKPFVLVLLSIFYGLAFIVTPYWMVAQSQLTLILILTLVVLSGIVWLALSGGEIRIRYVREKWIYFGIALTLLLAINYRSLVSAIAWRGDEHFHIENTLELVKKVPGTWFFAALIASGLMLFLAWRKPKWAMLLGIVLSALVVLFIILEKPLSDIPLTNLLRYPFVNYWLFSLIPKMSVFVSNPYQEYLYRIFPFIAIAGIVYLLQNELAVKKIYFNFLWMGVFATIPILLYYSTILYLEPLAVVLMLIVCLRIKTLLEGSFDQVKQDIGWYALILVGFIKETVLVFLVCFILMRLLTIWVKRNREFTLNNPAKPSIVWRMKFILGCMKNEILVMISLFLPLLIYLLLRSSFLPVRNFVPDPTNLADGAVYLAIARSFVEQFGGMVFLFLGGLGLLIWKKEYSSAFFFLLLVVAYPLFYAIDSKSYVGYSRFNLFVLPPILAGSSILIRKILSQNKLIGAFLGVILILINLYHSPLLADGTKKSQWGIYFSSITEEYYPYDEAFDWLAQEHRNAKILIAGFNYAYPFEFYFSKYDWSPTYRTLMINDAISETETLTSAVEKAEWRDMNLILFHVLEDETTLPRQVGDFQRVKTFKNLSHSIVVYKESH